MLTRPQPAAAAALAGRHHRDRLLLARAQQRRRRAAAHLRRRPTPSTATPDTFWNDDTIAAYPDTLTITTAAPRSRCRASPCCPTPTACRATSPSRPGTAPPGTPRPPSPATPTVQRAVPFAATGVHHAGADHVTADQDTPQGEFTRVNEVYPGLLAADDIPRRRGRLRQGRGRLPAHQLRLGLGQQPRRAAGVLRDAAVPHRPQRLHPRRPVRGGLAGHRPVRGARGRRRLEGHQGLPERHQGLRRRPARLPLPPDQPGRARLRRARPPSRGARSPSTRSGWTSPRTSARRTPTRGWFLSLRRRPQPLLVRRRVHQRAGHRHLPVRRRRPARRRHARAWTASWCCRTAPSATATPTSATSRSPRRTALPHPRRRGGRGPQRARRPRRPPARRRLDPARLDQRLHAAAVRLPAVVGDVQLGLRAATPATAATRPTYYPHLRQGARHLVPVGDRRRRPAEQGPERHVAGTATTRSWPHRRRSPTTTPTTCRRCTTPRRWPTTSATPPTPTAGRRGPSTVAAAVNAHLWDAAAGAYLDSATGAVRHAQDGNAIAITAGVADADRAASALAHLDATTVLPYGNAFMDNDTHLRRRLAAGLRLHLLPGTGRPLPERPGGLGARPDQAHLRLDGHATTPGITSWEGIGPGGSLYEGAYTSMAHGWSTGVLPALTNELLGVRPTAPGFATWSVAAAPGVVAWARGQVPTPHGPLTADWHQPGPGRLHPDRPRARTAPAAASPSPPAGGPSPCTSTAGRRGTAARPRRTAPAVEDGDVLLEGLTAGTHTVPSARPAEGGATLGCPAARGRPGPVIRVRGRPLGSGVRRWPPRRRACRLPWWWPAGSR